MCKKNPIWQRMASLYIRMIIILYVTIASFIIMGHMLEQELVISSHLIVLTFTIENVNDLIVMNILVINRSSLPSPCFSTLRRVRGERGKRLFHFQKKYVAFHRKLFYIPIKIFCIATKIFCNPTQILCGLENC